MTREVIMPALGMAQESGVIVSWLKSPGDPVKAGEPLMEVETDKAVVEVEAQADGYLTDLRAAAGDEVPVGEVIALISDTAEGSGGGAPAKAAASEAATAPRPELETVEPAPPVASKPIPAGPVAAPATGDRIVASPKAKRLAREQGLDLRRLVSAGHPQPFRANDIDTLAALTDDAPGAVAAASAEARLPDAAFQAFLDLLASEGDIPARHLIAAFASGAFRAATGRDAVSVRVVTPRRGAASYADPDRSRISEIAETEDTVPDLTVYDLTGSRIARVELSASNGPTASIGRDGDRLVLTFAAPPDRMGDDALIACLDDLAGRFDDPLRHLL